MNKNLVKNFLAFRNSQGRSRDAKYEQEDSPGDEVLAPDQGARGRMVRPRRQAVMGTEIHTVDFRKIRKLRKTLIFQRTRISARANDK
uniref:Uncharacterized protein n=1 Tax=Brassica oleracea var. oleracea TaxID=109376 RepID=A0A0D3CRK9_BRAOL